MLNNEDGVKDYGTKEIGIPEHLPELGKGERRKLSTLKLTVLSAISGFLFGYDTGVISGAMLMIRDQFSDITVPWHEAIVTATVVSAAVFALLGGPLNNKLGRKPVIQIASASFCIGSITLAAAQSKHTLFIGRLIVGAGVGLGSMTVPMYISETACDKTRGYMVVINQIMITFGILISCIADAIFSYRSDNGWRYMLGLAFIPAIVQLLWFFTMPESPRWLIEKGRHQEAVNVLVSMRENNTKALNEWQHIKNACKENEEEAKDAGRFSLLKMLRVPSIRRMLVLGCALQLWQQICGINTIMYYSSTIFRMSGYTNDTTAIWLSSLVAGVNFLFTLLGFVLVEKVGRRKLTIISLIGVAVSLTFIGLSYQFEDGLQYEVQVNNTGVNCTAHNTCDSCITSGCTYCLKPPVNQTKCFNAIDMSCAEHWNTTECPSNHSWVTVLGFILYLMCFAPGMGPMPWTINSELYPQWARSNGNACSTFVNWIANSVVSLTFLSLMQTITRQGTFYMYAILSIIGVLFFYKTLPETKGKSLEEIEYLFDKPWFVNSPLGNLNNETVHFHKTNDKE